MKLQNVILSTAVGILAVCIALSVSGAPAASGQRPAEGLGSTTFLPPTQTLILLPLISKGYPPPPAVMGVQTYWPLNNDNGLGEMQAMGARWVRVPLSWGSVEPSKTTLDRFDWSSWDAEASNAAAAGLTVIANVQGNPPWAAQYWGGPLYPGRVADFVAFMQAAAERYNGDGYLDAPGSPVIQYWELYNEPDNASYLLAVAGYGYWGDYGAQYADLYRQVYPAMKAVYPAVQLLNGGVAYERFREDDPDNPYVRRFLTDFFNAGGGNYIDAFNFHYYPNFASLWEPYGRELIGKTSYFRSMLASYELSIPIVCTEIGQHSDYARGSSDEAQSRYVVKTFAWAMAAGLQHAEWFAIRDITDGYPFLYGLLDSSWQRKRSFYAFRTIAQQLGRAVYVRTMTSGELGSPQAEGYVFQDAAEVVYVMWMNDEVTRTVQLAGSSALMVDKYGVQSSINAGTGSFVLQVKIGPSPAFVRPVP